MNVKANRNSNSNNNNNNLLKRSDTHTHRTSLCGSFPFPLGEWIGPPRFLFYFGVCLCVVHKETSCASSWKARILHDALFDARHSKTWYTRLRRRRREKEDGKVEGNHGGKNWQKTLAGSDIIMQFGQQRGGHRPTCYTRRLDIKRGN